MKKYSFSCGALTNLKDAKEVILRYQDQISSPCYVDLLTEKGVKEYYVERANIGTGWIVTERHRFGNSP